MKKIIRLTENDLARIVKRVINEQETNEFFKRKKELVLKSIMENINEHGLHRAVQQRLMENKEKDTVLQYIAISNTDYPRRKCKTNPSQELCGSKGKVIYDYIAKGMYDGDFFGLGTDEEAIKGAIYAVSDKKTLDELQAECKKKQKKGLMCWLQTEMPVNTYTSSGSEYEEPQTIFQYAHHYLKGEAGTNRPVIKEILRHLRQFDPSITACDKNVDTLGLD